MTRPDFEESTQGESGGESEPVTPEEGTGLLQNGGPQPSTPTRPVGKPDRS